MNGRAPNSPETGSHCRPIQNPNPNFWTASRESRKSMTPRATTKRMTRVANTPVPARKSRSSVDFGRDGGIPLLLRLLNLDSLERVLLELDHRVGKRGVAELARELLAVGERPLHEIDH